MRYKVEKKPSNTKGETWTPSTVRTIYREEFKRNIVRHRATQLTIFLSLFWEALRQENTYLNDVNIWDLSREKRREIFLRGYQMWILYETQVDRNKKT